MGYEVHRTGVEWFYAKHQSLLDEIRRGHEEYHYQERARPDLTIPGMYWECKWSSYDKHRPPDKQHYLQVAAIEFIMQVKHYKNFPTMYALYAYKDREWHVFSMKEALESMHHINRVDGCGDIGFLRQHLPDITNKKIPEWIVKTTGGSNLDMMNFSKNIKEDDYWVKKINEYSQL